MFNKCSQRVAMCCDDDSLTRFYLGCNFFVPQWEHLSSVVKLSPVRICAAAGLLQYLGSLKGHAPSLHRKEEVAHHSFFAIWSLARCQTSPQSLACSGPVKHRNVSHSAPIYSLWGCTSVQFAPKCAIVCEWHVEAWKYKPHRRSTLHL